MGSDEKCGWIAPAGKIFSRLAYARGFHEKAAQVKDQFAL
jgi:hypothetical protein